MIDRGAEKQVIVGVLDGVRDGRSGALVLRGDPGVGRTALLGYAVEQAEDLQIGRMVAVESEKSLSFAAVHQLLGPFLPAIERLPDPQRRALSVTFGLTSEPSASPFLVGLAVLTLLSDAAEARPVLLVIDDAQWLDRESADLLSFVGRRLLVDRVGLLFAVRETVESEPTLQALPDRVSIDQRKTHHDAKVAHHDAKAALDCADFAVDFAYDAIEEAEYAVLDAVLAGMDADEASKKDTVSS
jgi:hypothetical protein